MKLLTLKFGYYGHCGSALMLPTHRDHKNNSKGSMMALESCLQSTTKILVKWVEFADVTLEFCMDLVTSYATCLWHSLMSALGAVCRWWSFPPFFAFINSCYGPMGGAVSWLIVWEWRRHEKLCCAAGCSDLQNCSTVMDLTVCHSGCQIPHSMISSFVALLWLHVDSVQKRILRVYNQIIWLLSGNKGFKSFCILWSPLLIAS
jgi:hypothetical protein